MTEHEVETWVRNLAHEIPESSPPANLGATLRTARARGRRTMLLASIGAVAAVGLIGVGAAVAFQDDAAEDGSNVVATDGGSNSPRLACRKPARRASRSVLVRWTRRLATN